MNFPNLIRFGFIGLCVLMGYSTISFAGEIPNGRGQAGLWTLEINNGIAHATTRATNHDNISLRLVCGTDGIVKLILTVRVEGLDPEKANRLTGLTLPLQISFGDKSNFDVPSTVMSDARGKVALGHQVVSLSKIIMKKFLTNNKLSIKNGGELYKFSLNGAQRTIKRLGCMP